MDVRLVRYHKNIGRRCFYGLYHYHGTTDKEIQKLYGSQSGLPSYPQGQHLWIPRPQWGREVHDHEDAAGPDCAHTGQLYRGRKAVSQRPDCDSQRDRLLHRSAVFLREPHRAGKSGHYPPHPGSGKRRCGGCPGAGGTDRVRRPSGEEVFTGNETAPGTCGSAAGAPADSDPG